MSLSCYCPDDGDLDQWWYRPDDYSVLTANRSRRCRSCGELIRPGDLVAKFERERETKGDIEERIWGDEDVPMAPWYHCERCADLYFSLEELGFCVDPNDDMRELVKEYAEMNGR